MLKPFFALAALSPAQKAVLRSKKISGQYTPRQLLDLLKGLAEFDRASDKSRTPLGCTTALLFVVAIVCVFAGLIPVTLALLPLSFVALFGVLKLGKLDLSNNVREVAMPFFAVLDQDMAADQPLQVSLDLSSPMVASKKTATGKAYQRGAYHKVVDTSYQDDWFSGAAKLADGSVLHWSIEDALVSSARTKRTTRGKTKTKSATYKRSTIHVALALPVDDYAVANIPAAPGGKLKLVAGEKRNTVKLATKLKTRTADPIDPRALIDLVAQAYRRAKPATTRSAA